MKKSKQLEMFGTSIFDRVFDKIRCNFFKSINYKQFLFGLVFGLILSIVIIFAQSKKQYAYLDVELVISTISQKLVNEENLESAIANHKIHFEKILKDYSNANNIIIFSSPKPIAGASNITKYFVQEMTNFDYSILP